MVNAGDLFAGAAVGGAFGPVFDVFREVVEKTVEFNPTLKSVKSTVDSLALLIPQIEDRNQILGGNRQGEVKEVREKMEEGKKLIEELLEVNEWSCLKAHYTDQLVELDESLKRLLEILQVQVVIDVKEGLALTKDASKDAKESLALTKDSSKDTKESLALLKEYRSEVVGFAKSADSFKAGLVDIQKSQEVMLQDLKLVLKFWGLADKGVLLKRLILFTNKKIKNKILYKIIYNFSFFKKLWADFFYIL